MKSSYVGVETAVHADGHLEGKQSKIFWATKKQLYNEQWFSIRVRPSNLTYVRSTFIWQSSVSWDRGYLPFWNWTTGSVAPWRLKVMTIRSKCAPTRTFEFGIFKSSYWPRRAIILIIVYWHSAVHIEILWLRGYPRTRQIIQLHKVKAIKLISDLNCTTNRLKPSVKL